MLPFDGYWPFLDFHPTETSIFVLTSTLRLDNKDSSLLILIPNSRGPGFAPVRHIFMHINGRSGAFPFSGTQSS